MVPLVGDAWFVQLQKALDVLTVQHRTIANNVANVNTPAFVKQKVDFQAELERLLQSGAAAEGTTLRAVPGAVEPGREASAAIEATADPTGPARADGNNVSLEKEMVGMAETGEVYAALARIAQKNIRLTRYVISGGRG